jgi:biopolymer transport protein ExbD
MRFAVKNRSKAPSLSLTSMLDVIFLLLFYFAAMSVQQQWEYDMQVSLPEAKTAVAPERLPGELVLNVHRDGKVIVNNMDLTLEDLGARLAKIAEIFPDQTVVLRADADTDYGIVVKVIDTCRGAGVYNYSLATAGAPASGKTEAK